MSSWPNVTPMEICQIATGVYDTIERPATAGFCSRISTEKISVDANWFDVCWEHAVRGEVLGIFIRNPDRPRWTATPRCVERFCGGEMYFVEEIGSYHRYSCKECGRSQFEDGP